MQRVLYTSDPVVVCVCAGPDELLITLTFTWYSERMVPVLCSFVHFLYAYISGECKLVLVVIYIKTRTNTFGPFCSFFFTPIRSHIPRKISHRFTVVQLYTYRIVY